MDDGSCVYAHASCSDSSAANFARGRICRYGGCLEARAQNFDPSADFDDGSCAVAAGVLGCTDSAAEATALAHTRGAEGDVYGKCCIDPAEEPFYTPVIQERAWTSPIWYEPVKPALDQQLRQTAQ